MVRVATLRTCRAFSPAAGHATIAGSFSSVSMWMGTASGLEKTPSKPGAPPSPRPKEPWERRVMAMEALFTSRMVLWEGRKGGKEEGEGGKERVE